MCLQDFAELAHVGVEQEIDHCLPLPRGEV